MKVFHVVIWNRCPKHAFASRDTVEVATLLSVGEINMGSSASHNFMTAQGLVVGENTQGLGKQRDNARTANSPSLEMKQQQRREKVRLAREVERRNIFRLGVVQPMCQGASKVHLSN